MSEPKERLARVSLRPEAELDLRALARRELRERSGTEGVVSRVLVEVRIGDRTELVAIALDGGRLAISATDGTSPLSPAALRALSFLAGAEGPTEAVARPPQRPARHANTLQVRLTELAIAISRSGVEAADPASVREALPRLLAELPSPLPLAVARWVARLVTALAESDARQVARLFAGRVGSVEPAWPFVSAERAISDRRFIEIGRECVEAHGPFPIERRILVDEERNDLLVEQRYLRAGPLEASMGPCPRLLDVGLGVLGDGLPAELKAQQYTLSSEVPHATWDRIENLAGTVVAAQAAALASLKSQPAGEPLALIAFPSLEDGVLIDGEGTRIPMSKEDPGAVEALADHAKRARLRWVLGRWATRDTGLSLVPLSAAHLEGAAWRHIRLR